MSFIPGGTPMRKMKAVILKEVKNLDSLRLEEFPYPTPAEGQAVVQIKAAALNHRDVWIVQGLYAKIKLPVVLGSDGSGIVVEVGAGVDKSWIGREVIINPSLNWGVDPRAQGANYRILGMPDNGTQAEYVVIPAQNLVEKPAYLSFEEAAAIPLGGLTGYRALFTRGRLKAAETVLITGIGGGVASLMMQMALAAGARVIVTSGSDRKLQDALKKGAAGGANYRQTDWVQQIKQIAAPRGVDLVIDSAGGEGFARLVEIVNAGGRIVFFGATAGNPSQINLRRIFWRQVDLMGTTMGSPVDFSEMVRLFEMHQIRPIIDKIHKIEDYQSAYERMMKGEQFGKIVLQL